MALQVCPTERMGEGWRDRFFCKSYFHAVATSRGRAVEMALKNGFVIPEGITYVDPDTQDEVTYLGVTSKGEPLVSSFFSDEFSALPRGERPAAPVFVPQVSQAAERKAVYA